MCVHTFNNAIRKTSAKHRRLFCVLLDRYISKHFIDNYTKMCYNKPTTLYIYLVIFFSYHGKITLVKGVFSFRLSRDAKNVWCGNFTGKHFFGASLVGALFYFQEGIMRFEKIIVCLLAVFILSSCVNTYYPDDTTVKNDVVTEAVTDTVEDTTVAEETEQTAPETFAKETVGKPFIANIKTKKFHNEDCRYVGFMNEENKLFITSTTEKLQSQGYSPCAFCQK